MVERHFGGDVGSKPTPSLYFLKGDRMILIWLCIMIVIIGFLLMLMFDDSAIEIVSIIGSWMLFIGSIGLIGIFLWKLLNVYPI